MAPGAGDTGYHDLDIASPVSNPSSISERSMSSAPEPSSSSRQKLSAMSCHQFQAITRSPHRYLSSQSELSSHQSSFRCREAGTVRSSTYPSQVGQPCALHSLAIVENAVPQILYTSSAKLQLNMSLAQPYRNEPRYHVQRA